MSRRRKETQAEMEVQATDYLARILLEKECKLTYEEAKIIWQKMPENERNHYLDVARTALAEMQRQYEERWAKAERSPMSRGKSSTGENG